jgi:SAM-dependent methyltransferase
VEKASFLAAITTPHHRDSWTAAIRRDPALQVLSRILGPERSSEWLLTLGYFAVPDLPALEPPIPPVEIRAGTPPAPEQFLWRGLEDAVMFQRLFDKFRQASVGRPRVLDYGCNCARIARFLVRLPWDLHGCDVNEQTVAWCHEHLPGLAATVSAARPPLAYADSMFDYVYCYSVFTHFQEVLTLEWLHELRRITRHTGILAFTTNGPTWIESILRQPNLQEQFKLPEATLLSIRDRIEGGECVFLPYPDSDDYGLTFIHPDRVAREWTKTGVALLGQELGSTVHGGNVNSAQDVTVFMRV